MRQHRERQRLAVGRELRCRFRVVRSRDRIKRDGREVDLGGLALPRLTNVTPEQQIKAFKAKGTFPSQVEALTSDDLLSQTNAFFNDAPTGQILADRATAVTVAPVKGPNYFSVNDAMQQAISRVDVDETDDMASSWAKFEEAVNALG